MKPIEKIKEAIITKIAYSIKNTDVLKRIAITCISFAKNIDNNILIGDINANK